MEAFLEAPTPARGQHRHRKEAPKPLFCTPLCTKCGLHPANPKKGVTKGLCCNKCPNHGPWCTVHMAAEELEKAAAAAAKKSAPPLKGDKRSDAPPTPGPSGLEA